MTTITCTRPSTLAGALEDKSGLMPYVASSALKTIAQNPDLMTRLSLTRGESWRDFKPLYEEADKRGGGREASDGTNIHMVVEALANGYDVSMIPEPARSDGQAVFDYITSLGFRIMSTETFVVTIDPALPEPCAGTTDLILQAPSGRLFIGDTKSAGAHDDGKFGALKWSIQEAIYARGKPYAGHVGRDRWGRPTIDTEHIREWARPIETSHGLVLQVERGSASVRPFWLDLDAGWDMARAACDIRARRKVGQSGALIVGAPAWAS